MIFPVLASLSLATTSFAYMTHNVTVGAGGALAFSPNSITAAIGDTVQFLFEAKNHTATQSSFQSPCSRLIGADGVSIAGFDSGFQPIDPAGDVKISSFQVTVDTPLWFYCRQTGHCAQGMVFAVNAPATGNTFQQFLANALASGNTASTTTTTAAIAPSTTTSQTTTTTSSFQTITTSAPAVSVVTVTETITLGTSTWTTTYGSYPGSPDATPNPEPVVHTVKVGENGALTFNPANITAQPRDIVMFEFLAKNHTATQSTFAQPCRPIGDVTSTSGFDSGFKPVTAGDLVPQLFNITVQDTAPIWVYCKQTNPVSHCGAGMVFSVNAVESGPNNFEAYLANAERINGTSFTNTASASTSTTSKPGAATSTRPSTLLGLGLGLSAALWMLVL